MRKNKPWIIIVVVVLTILIVCLSIFLPKSMKEDMKEGSDLIDTTLTDAPEIVSSVVVPCTGDTTCQNKVDIVLTWKKKTNNAVVSVQRQGAYAINTEKFSFTDTNLSPNATYVYTLKYIGAFETITRVVKVGDFDQLCATLPQKDNVNNVCVVECSGKGSRNVDKICVCNTGFVGPRCQFSDAATCGGNGTVNVDGTCACNAGFVGPMCQYNDAVTCSGHGTANDDGTCSCNAGFDGRQCQFSDAVTCNSHGDVNNDGTCVCDYNHIGINCEQENPVRFTDIQITPSTLGMVNIALAFTGKPGMAYKMRFENVTIDLGTFDASGNGSFTHLNQNPVPHTYELAYDTVGAEWVTQMVTRYACDGKGECTLTGSTDPTTTFASQGECTCYECQTGKCTPVSANVKGTTTYDTCKNVSSCEWTRYACDGKGECALTGSTDPTTTFASQGECTCYACQAGKCTPVAANVKGTTTYDTCKNVSSCEWTRYACDGKGACALTAATDPNTTFATQVDCTCNACQAGICTPTPANTKGSLPVGCHSACQLFGNNDTSGLMTLLEEIEYSSSKAPKGALSTAYPLKVLNLQSASVPDSSGSVRFTGASYTSPQFKYYPMFIFTANGNHVVLNSNPCWVGIEGGSGNDAAQVQTVLVPWGNIVANKADVPLNPNATTSRSFGVHNFINIPMTTDVIATGGSPQYANGRDWSSEAPGFKALGVPVTINKQYAIAVEVLVATDDYVTMYWDLYYTYIKVPAVINTMFTVNMPSLNVVSKTSTTSAQFSTTVTPNALITMKAGVTETRYNELSPRIWFDSSQLYLDTTPSVSIGFKILTVNATSTTVSIRIELGVYEVAYDSTNTVPVKSPPQLGQYSYSTSLTSGSVLDFAGITSTNIVNLLGANSRQFVISPSVTTVSYARQARRSGCTIT